MTRAKQRKIKYNRSKGNVDTLIGDFVSTVKIASSTTLRISAVIIWKKESAVKVTVGKDIQKYVNIGLEIVMAA